MSVRHAKFAIQPKKSFLYVTTQLYLAGHRVNPLSFLLSPVALVLIGQSLLPSALFGSVEPTGCATSWSKKVMLCGAASPRISVLSLACQRSRRNSASSQTIRIRRRTVLSEFMRQVPLVANTMGLARSLGAPALRHMAPHRD